MAFAEINPDHPYEEITEEIWNYIYERDQGTCQVTGTRGTEIHHIVFKSHGGDNRPSNLVLVSKKGHAKQHGPTQWRIKKGTLKKKVQENEERFRRRMV